MPLACNIDIQGRSARLRGGLIAILLAGAVAALGAWFHWGAIVWILAAALLAGGGFMIFEARKGWCALRAMGIKTRI